MYWLFNDDVLRSKDAQAWDRVGGTASPIGATCGHGKIYALVGREVRGSSDGASWSTLTTFSAASTWGGVAFGADRVAAVLGSEIRSSADGTNWDVGAFPGLAIRTVRWIHDRFFAIWRDGVHHGAVVSTDGINWRVSTLGAGDISNAWQISWDGSRFMAVTGAAARTMRSSDGIGWALNVDAGLPARDNAYGWACSVRGATVVGLDMFSYGGSSTFVTTDGGMSWSPVASVLGDLSTVSWEPGVFNEAQVCVLPTGLFVWNGTSGPVRGWFSSDGRSWSDVALPAGITTGDYSAVAYPGGRYVLLQVAHGTALDCWLFDGLGFVPVPAGWGEGSVVALSVDAAAYNIRALDGRGASRFYGGGSIGW